MELLLRPGTPDDDNRDYLPEKIKGTDIVVNENGNNSQPYPMNLKECTGVLTADGKEDTWYEYIPAGYDGTTPVPLVVSLHGGLMTGWGQCIYTSWSVLAEQNNFIAVFPNASSKRVWCVEWGKWRFDGSEGTTENENPPPEADKSPEDPMENHDVAMLLGLIDRMKQTYNIDPQRIYMQGMSMGNLMTALFSRYFGNLLAGAAGSGCATFTDRLLTPEGVLKNKGGGIAAFCKIDMHILPSDTSRLIAYGHKIDRYTREEYCRLSVAVATRFRRKGMGRALFWAMVSFAQAGDKKYMLISDGVTDKNTAGCAYCRAMGFKGLGKFSDLEGKSRVDGILPLYK